MRRLSTTQIMPYAELFARGDIDKRGLDKVDLDEIFGKYSYKNVEYIIKTFKVSSKNRLQFTDFLKLTLPEGIEIDEEKAMDYYLNRIQMISRN
jgi:Ca2+-binding EF-hand superfamily protein